jgi:hypothetical protein
MRLAKAPPAALRGPRPDGALDAAEYDMMQIVWHGHTDIGAEDLADRSSRFTDMFLKLRDALKEANEALRALEQQAAPTATARASATSNAETQRDAMELALTTANVDGHARILDV